MSSLSARSCTGGVKSSPLNARLSDAFAYKQAASTHIVPPSNVRMSFLCGCHRRFITLLGARSVWLAYLSYSTLSIFEKSPKTQYAVCKCPLHVQQDMSNWESGSGIGTHLFSHHAGRNSLNNDGHRSWMNSRSVTLSTAFELAAVLAETVAGVGPK